MKTRFDLLGHAFIALTIALTVYGQLVLKWQMSGVGPLPAGGAEKFVFLLKQLLNPWVFTGYVAALLASLAWMAAMTRFDIGYAYPFMSLAFVIVMGFGALFLNESLSLQKILGTLIVMLGLVLIAKS